MKQRNDSIMMIGMVVAVAAIVVAGLIGYYFGVSSTPKADQQQREVAMTGEEQGSGAQAMPAGSVGRATFSEVAELALDTRNGTVTVSEDVTLAAGVVDLTWDYRLDDEPYTAGDVELRCKQDGAVLNVEDWTGRRSWLDDTPKLTLTLRHGPGVASVEASHGNGTFTYSGPAGGDFAVGNGKLSLSGDPAGDLSASIGNGKLTADILAAAGDIGLSVGNGTAKVQLRQGSGGQLEASVGIGDIHAPAGVTVARSHMLGATASGSVGSGEASIEIDVGNGSINVTGA